MSRDFDSASAGKLELAEAIITARPFSFACWFRKEGTSGAQGTLISINDGTANNFFRLHWTATTLFLALQSEAGGSNSATGTTAIQPDTWYHGAGVGEEGVSDRVYLNGVQEGTQGVVKVPAGLSTTDIGVRNSASHPMNGLIAEVGIWNAVLTLDEIKALAAGEVPARVRPGSLKLYLPIWGIPVAGPEVDHFGNGKSFTVSADAQVLGRHAPVTRYAKKRLLVTPIMPPGGSGSPLAVMQAAYRRRAAS